MPPKKKGAKKIAPKDAAKVKREIQLIERELGHLAEVQWKYAKGMLKFGFASWIIGIMAFVASIILLGLWDTIHPFAIFLIILASAAPVIVTAILIQKFRLKIKRLEEVRRRLLAEYEAAILRRVGKLI